MSLFDVFDWWSDGSGSSSRGGSVFWGLLLAAVGIFLLTTDQKVQGAAVLVVGIGMVLPTPRDGTVLFWIWSIVMVVAFGTMFYPDWVPWP